MSNVICFATEKRRRASARRAPHVGSDANHELQTLDGQLAAVESEQAHYRGLVATSDKLSRAYVTALMELVALQLRHQGLTARRRRLERKVFNR